MPDHMPYGSHPPDRSIERANLREIIARHESGHGPFTAEELRIAEAELPGLTATGRG